MDLSSSPTPSQIANTICAHIYVSYVRVSHGVFNESVCKWETSVVKCTTLGDVIICGVKKSVLYLGTYT